MRKLKIFYVLFNCNLYRVIVQKGQNGKCFQVFEFIPCRRRALLHPAVGSGASLGRPRLRGGVHQENQLSIKPSCTSGKIC